MTNSQDTNKRQQEPVATASAWFALVMNAAAELEGASHCLRDEDAKRVSISGAKHYRDAAKALYTAPQPRQPLTVWQPIETAPKECTFLVYEGFEGTIELAHIDSDGDIRPFTSRGRFWRTPTHWMPLPPPPVTKK